MTRSIKTPLHGVSLKVILTDLVERYDWEELGDRIRIKCFQMNPSIKSSLTFLRKTEWARRKVEDLYLRAHDKPVPKRAPLPPTPEVEKKDSPRKEPRSGINPWTGKPYTGDE